MGEVVGLPPKQQNNQVPPPSAAPTIDELNQKIIGHALGRYKTVGKAFFWIFLTPFLLAGIGATAFGAKGLWDTRELLAHSVTTTGQVIYLATTVDSKHRYTSYSPVVSFKDTAGITHTFTSSFYSNSVDHPVGSQVEVVYKQGDPGMVQINDFSNLWEGNLMFVVFGLIFTVSALIMATLSKAARFFRQSEITLRPEDIISLKAYYKDRLIQPEESPKED